MPALLSHEGARKIEDIHFMKEFDGKNILVVDDEEDLRENLAIYLGMKGAKVVKASHGLEALE